MKLRLKNKVALITGGTSGIGKSIAILFAKEGARVAIIGLKKTKGQETQKIISEHGGNCIFIRGDVSNAKDTNRIVAHTVESFGQLNILVNSAGIELVKSILDTSEEEWNKVVDVNLKSIFLLSKKAIPEIIKSGGGAILNISSNAGVDAMENNSAYCTAKGGAILLTKAIALDCANKNIRVNCICPGATDTPMLEREIAQTENPTAHRKWFNQLQPIGRIIKPEEIANAALFLVSDDAKAITGVTLPVDGGALARLSMPPP